MPSESGREQAAEETAALFYLAQQASGRQWVAGTPHVGHPPRSYSGRQLGWAGLVVPDCVPGPDRRSSLALQRILLVVQRKKGSCDEKPNGLVEGRGVARIPED